MWFRADPQETHVGHLPAAVSCDSPCSGWLGHRVCDPICLSWGGRSLMSLAQAWRGHRLQPHLVPWASLSIQDFLVAKNILCWGCTLLRLEFPTLAPQTLWFDCSFQIDSFHHYISISNVGMSMLKSQLSLHLKGTHGIKEKSEIVSSYFYFCLGIEKNNREKKKFLIRRWE